MKRHLKDIELSAYLDGEARDPSGVERHLQQCARCAKRHMELGRLSAHVRSLTGPDVSVGFADGVLLAIEERRRPREAWLLHWGMPLATAAVLILVAITFMGPTGPFRAADVSRVAFESDTQGDEDALDRLAALLAEYPDGDPTLAGVDYDTFGLEETREYDMLLALADEDWFSDLAVEWDEDADLDEELDWLDENESEALTALLSDLLERG